MRLCNRLTIFGVTVACGTFLGLAGCASTPRPAADVETAMDCDDLSVAVPDPTDLRRTNLERDTRNWRQIEARQRAGDSGTARWSTSATFAIQVRPDGSVARACLMDRSDLIDRDRSWLEAITIARFRQGDATTGRWLRVDL